MKCSPDGSVLPENSGACFASLASASVLGTVEGIELNHSSFGVLLVSGGRIGSSWGKYE